MKKGYDFLQQVFDTGVASENDIARFMIFNYFLKGYNLDDFQEDLVLNYNQNEKYAKALRDSFEESLIKFSLY